jgi:DNA-directed RNA polymerase specialized sigma24 family protein
MADFADFYKAQVAYVYRLCYRLEGEAGKAERLLAEVWKKIFESFPEQGDVSVLLCRHVAHAHRRLARAVDVGTTGSATEAAVAKLAPEYRLPLVLKEAAGLSYPNIALALDIPQSTVRARLGRARGLIRPTAGGPASVDDELVSAYLDGELEPREVIAVEGLFKREQSWSHRLDLFKEISQAWRSLAPPPPLSDERMDIVYRSVTESFDMGAERRRVPRYKRRWMLMAAFAVPCLLTLLYLQNPNQGSRLFLRGDELVLRAGRSGQKTVLAGVSDWTSAKLWGAYDPDQRDSSLGFQLDAGRTETGRSVQAVVLYDFDGDGTTDREERFEAVGLDAGPGWERFHPPLLSAKGPFQDFRGGTVTVRLSSPERQQAALELSGSPGELVLPYRGLSSVEPLAENRPTRRRS